MNKKFYLDEDVVASAFFGEFGWFLQRYQARMRFIAKKVYPDRKMIIFTDIQNSVFLNDFVYATIQLPNWFYKLNLDRDCYEAVLPNAPSGSLTPPNVYSNLISYMREFYNIERAKEILSPRGCNFSYDKQQQLFCKFESKKLSLDKPVIVVLPRLRTRATDRNVPEKVWIDLVEKLKKEYIVVIAGTQNGACLQDYEGPNIINLVKYNKPDKTDRVITYLNNCVCSISSQSGGTHISLLSGANSYIIGHERERHTVFENRLNVPTSFRYVNDYRLIDADTIFSDVTEFIDKLKDAGYIDIISEDINIMNELIKQES